MTEQTERIRASPLRRKVATFLWWALTSLGNAIIGTIVGVAILLIERPLLLWISHHDPLRQSATQVALGIALSRDAVSALEIVPVFAVATIGAGAAAGLAQVAVQSLARGGRAGYQWVLAPAIGWGSGALVTMLIGVILTASERLTASGGIFAGMDRAIALSIVVALLIGIGILAGLIVWASQWLVLSRYAGRSRWRMFANTISYYPTFVLMLVYLGVMFAPT